MEPTSSPNSTGLNGVNSESSNAGDSGIAGMSDFSRQAESFLEEQGSKFHPIFDSEDGYWQQRSKAPTQTAFKLAHILSNTDLESESTHLHATQFLEVMETYQASSKEPKIREVNIRGKHSWDEVLRVAKDAETAYIKAGGKGLRKAGRWISVNCEAAMPFIRIIPDGFYWNILSGGLKLIFGALSQISEKQDRVTKALLRIPNVIAQAERCVESFPADQVLYEKAADLYLAILGAIEGTTRWLTRHPAIKQIRASVLGPLFNRSFKQKIELLDQALAALQERVSTLTVGTVVRTGNVVESVVTVVNEVVRTGSKMDSTTTATLHEVHDMHSEVKTLNDTADRTDEKVSSITEDMKNLAKAQNETHRQIKEMSDLEKVKEEAKRAMKTVLKETAKTAAWMEHKERVINRLRWQVEMLEKTAATLTPGDLLDILNIGADSSTLDLQRVSRAGQSTDVSPSYLVRGITESKGVLESRRFQEWLGSDASAVLFIEGGFSSQSYGRNTPMSLISTAVIESFEDHEPAIAIHFFCGSHTSSRDPVKGPHGMMRSLICQILRLFSVKLDFVTSHRYREQLQTYNLRTLCHCFAKLIKQLPMDTVLICVIDSINLFEKKDWEEDCRKVVNDLQDLADDDELGALFKLLMTSPSRSRYVGGMLPAQCRILMPGNESGGRDGPTDREINMRARRPARARGSSSLQPGPSSHSNRGGVYPAEYDSESDASFDPDLG